MAEHAVGLVPGAEPAAVRVDRTEDDVAVAVRVALGWPAPVREAAAEVRRSVVDEVERITGYRVRSVAVTVAELRTGPRTRVG
ncbi:Asp23/Gls24 family envelope stress response protein [Saccharothrix sp. BKS2]|uniref:Asp23/Gls24 family envelope stress response protein n=1 Tax=Saccharothrix sp. BKS2 TaxID=3064400 RepID=UPI0039EB3C6D